MSKSAKGARRGQGERRSGRRQTGLGGEQVEGRQAVRELLLAGRRRVAEVLVDRDGDEVLAELVDLAREVRIPTREVSAAAIDRAAQTSAPQGVVATAAPVAPVELGELLEGEADAFLLVLDGITDPGNLGAILRTADCSGVTGVVLPKHRSARLGPAAVKAAAGAVEHLRFASVGGVPAALGDLQGRGVWTVGLDAAGDRSLFGLPVATEPLALVLGAEGRGLARLVRARCDEVVSIPVLGATGSLNVSVAAGVACYEIVRSRQRPG